jgi:hypothetical protein
MNYRWKNIKYHQTYENKAQNIQSREEFAKRIIYLIEN